MTARRRVTSLPSERTPAREDAAGFDTAISLDATRVPQDPASIAARAATAKRARGNLAAMVCQAHGVDPATHTGDLRAAAKEFAYLADALGLNP